MMRWERHVIHTPSARRFNHSLALGHGTLEAAPDPYGALSQNIRGFQSQDVTSSLAQSDNDRARLGSRRDGAEHGANLGFMSGKNLERIRRVSIHDDDTKIVRVVSEPTAKNGNNGSGRPFCRC